jgi:hypothetical protein
VTYHLLSKNLQGKIEFLLAFYKIGARTGPKPYTHRGEECALVLKGKLEIQIGSSICPLKKDNSPPAVVRSPTGSGMCVRFQLSASGVLRPPPFEGERNDKIGKEDENEIRNDGGRF